MKELKLKNIDNISIVGFNNTPLSEINGVESVDANHNTGIVTITSKEDIDVSKIKERIIDIGFEIVEE